MKPIRSKSSKSYSPQSDELTPLISPYPHLFSTPSRQESGTASPSTVSSMEEQRIYPLPWFSSPPQMRKKIFSANVSAVNSPTSGSTKWWMCWRVGQSERWRWIPCCHIAWSSYISEDVNEETPLKSKSSNQNEDEIEDVRYDVDMSADEDEDNEDDEDDEDISAEGVKRCGRILLILSLLLSLALLFLVMSEPWKMQLSVGE